MKILPLVISPDPLLKEISKPVEKVDAKLQELMNNMVQTMYHNRGIGLAAVQVGVLKRVLVMDLDYSLDDCCESSGCDVVHPQNSNPKFLVNPEIIQASDKYSSFDEGCLSFPGAISSVDRPKEVVIKYLDFDGNEREEKVTGIQAVCVQHEIDHLNGITFVDHISKLKRDRIITKMKKLAKKKF